MQQSSHNGRTEVIDVYLHFAYRNLLVSDQNIFLFYNQTCANSRQSTYEIDIYFRDARVIIIQEKNNCVLYLLLVYWTVSFAQEASLFLL